MTGIRLVIGAVAATGLMIAGANLNVRPAQDGVPAYRAWTVTARGCAFTPSRIEATQGDIVGITFAADDRPHSFVIDAYRIAKRATPGHSLTFEFLASQAGTFPFYSDLTSDRDCRDMRGELVVHSAR